MMGGVEMLALSLGLSVGVAGLGLAGGTLVERISDDPRLRDRVWGAALMSSLLPPVVTALLLMTPAPVREVATPTALPVVVTSIKATTAAPAQVQAFAPSLDPGLIATILLVLVGALVLLRLTILMRRGLRLSALLKGGQAADDATTDLVREVSRALAIPAPTVVVSVDATEPLLTGLRSARLVLPVALPEGEAVRQAVITHELAHLKRGDHRALWMEEAALTLLAFNPLAPLLRARRSAAREEACDALALTGAGSETRRAYAQSLIEALRTRAGSHGSGALPALTFTGAGRTTAMHRLKAVLTPAAPASRRARLGALMTGVVGLALVGAGSAALAAQREPTLQERPQYSATARFEPDVRELLNGAPVPEGLPIWALSPDRVVITPVSEGINEVNFILPFNGRAPVSVDGRRMPEGFPVSGLNPDAVAKMEREGDHTMVTLKPEAEVRGHRYGEDAAERAATTSVQASYRAETEEKFQRVSAADYRRYCASDKPDEAGFCAGVMFGQIDSAGVCTPAELSDGNSDRGPALNAYVARGKQEVARLSPRRDEGAHEYASRAIQAAYPCPADRAENSRVVTWMPVTIEGRGQLNPGDRMRVTLTDPSGALLAESVTMGDGEVRIPLTEAEFPRLGQGNRTYTLSGAIHRADGSVQPVREPTTLRLGAGSQRSARNLTATVDFGG
jgi:beta-lactamase regulating signal transducer with metallopeptidase domain